MSIQQSSLRTEIYALNLPNPHSGYDVEGDDISQYESEAGERNIQPTVEGFKAWLVMDCGGWGTDPMFQAPRPAPRIIVVVSGGVATYIADQGVDVAIYDWDSEGGNAKSALPSRFADLIEKHAAGIPVVMWPG